MAKEVSLKVYIDAVTDKAVDGLNRFQSSLGGLAQVAGGVALGNMLTSAARGVMDLGKQGLEAVASYEQLSFTLESMMASELRARDASLTMQESLNLASGKAKDTLKWLEDLSLVSPFESSTVRSVFQMQMRLGASSEEARSLTEAMLNLGASSGMSSEALAGAGYALSQIRASDKLVMQDLRQLLNAGVDVNAILGRMGYKLSDVGNKAISSADFIKAFYEQAGEAGDAVDRMASTLPGMLGAFNDFKDIGLRELFTPLFTALKPVIKLLMEWMMGPGREALAQMGQSLGMVGAHISNLIMALRDGGLFGKQFSEALGRISPVAQEIWDTRLKPFIEQGLAWVTANKDALIGALQGMAIAFGALIVIGTVAALVKMLTDPLFLIMALAGLLGAAWTQNWGGIQEKTAAVWEWLKTAFENIKSWLQVAIPAALNWLNQAWANIWGAIQAVTSVVFPIIQNLFRAFSAAFRGDWSAFGSYLRDAWDALWRLQAQILANAWATIRTIISNLITGIKNFFTQTDWRAVGKAIIDGIVNGITNAAKALADAAANAAKAALAAARGFLKSKSPSRLFEEKVGIPMIEGWVSGIQKAVPALELATAYAGARAYGAGQQVINNYNLTVQSMRSSEQVIQDFWLMRL